MIALTSTYLNPVHFVNGVCGAGAHSNDDDVGCIPDRCNSTLSRGTGRAGSRLLTHARCTLSQNNSTSTTTRIAVTSRYLLGLRQGTGAHGPALPGAAPLGLHWQRDLPQHHVHLFMYLILKLFTRYRETAPSLFGIARRSKERKA
ncbi:unnamed protein product [Chrysodeixis includens]|uniref:Uncharacterized protein n=1 Tax=Chrysodeixis includens TaxID=689277 RepID=A0A9N8L0B6_CHRIL|nr:unnamed protein product [Chrysodeixis includens]